MADFREVLLGLGVYLYICAIVAAPWGIMYLIRVSERLRRLAPPKKVSYVLDLRRVGSWQK
jgi:hypothetical protein